MREKPGYGAKGHNLPSRSLQLPPSGCCVSGSGLIQEVQWDSPHSQGWAYGQDMSINVLPF